MRLLDHIPELVGAAYNVAPSPAFKVNGTLYTVHSQQLYKDQLMSLVRGQGHALWVYSCDVLLPNVYGRSSEQCYLIRSAVVKSRLATMIVLRKLK